MKPHLPLLLRKAMLAGVSALVTFSQCGTFVFAESQDLIYQGTNLIWDTSAENKAFVVADGETSSAFGQGDNVSFTSTSDVALGENITVGTISIEEGADVTIKQENYTLTAEKIAVSGTLDMGNSLYVGAGATLSIESPSAVLKSNLTLSNEGALSVNGSASLNNNTLILHGGTDFRLSSTGDGCVYDLFSNISNLKDAEGNTISLNSTNNKAALYFDATQPGTGFWANATLQLNDDGTLQLVRHNQNVKNPLNISTREANPNHNYYSSVKYQDITHELSSYYEYPNGGVIYGNVTLNNNGNVAFIENKVTGSDASGGVIYASGDLHGCDFVQINSNGTVIFESNSANRGGAIFIGNASAELNSNNTVSFIKNTALYDGGAINNVGRIVFDNNTFVTFEDNEAGYGGAVHGAIELRNNSSVLFTNNVATSGGAIMGSTQITGNGIVSFVDNISSYDGGAIEGGNILLNGNKTVNFESNSASRYGAAIYSSYIINLSNNENISFTKNILTAGDSLSTQGGAIYARGGLTIANNRHTEFSGNIETKIVGTGYGNPTLTKYRLRSIYVPDESNNLVSLSAPEQGNIVFYDSIYIGENTNFSLNANFTDIEGINHSQTGDIIFTGVATETNLLIAKGSSGTYEELVASRTSEVNTMTNLYGGNLIIENGAVYKGNGITVHDDSSARVLVKNAEINLNSDALILGAGSQLHLEGENLIRGNISASNDSSLSFDLSGGKGVTAVLGDLQFKGNFDISLVSNKESELNNVVLLFVTDTVSGWDGHQLKNSTEGSYAWIDNLLVYNYHKDTFSKYYNGAASFSTQQASSSFYHHYSELDFCNNSASSSGGAICGIQKSDISLSYNQNVAFKDNASASIGGAIYVDEESLLTISHNENVTFERNTVSAVNAWGGAIYASLSDVHIHNNKNVLFIANRVATTSSANTFANGAAICGGQTNSIVFDNNETVSFIGNKADAKYACGGAIDGKLIMTNNGSILFEANTSGYRGGAIHAGPLSPITISNNGTVLFYNNSSLGGGSAIYSDGDLFIQNNDFVEFYGNSQYCIYTEDRSNANVTFSAAEGKHIVFRDAVYIGMDAIVNFNDKYESREQKGDIIFTGAPREESEHPVENSINSSSPKTSICAKTILHAGRLCIEDGAVFSGRGLTALESSNSTVRVKDAELRHRNYVMEFNDGTKLEVAGNSTIRGEVVLKDGSLFKLEKAACLNLHETLEADVATLTVNGTALLEGGSTLNANLTISEGATLDMGMLNEGSVTLNGALTLGGLIRMGDSMISLLDELTTLGDSLTLFTGITEFVLPQLSSEEITERVWLENVFTNIEQSQTYYFDYSEKMGSLSIVAATDIVPAPNPMIPEPTTATLSLLALAGLAARRRRK